MTAHEKLVAVRFLDKRLVKGWTADFWPDRDFFHVGKQQGGTPKRIPVRDLKGIFFLKTPGRDSRCVDKRVFCDRPGTERKVWLEFRDGEKLAGWSNSCGSSKGGFFVVPADSESNVEKAYVFRSALIRLKEGLAAEEASRTYCHATDTAPQDAGEQAEPEQVGSYRLGREELRRRGHGREEI